MPVHRIALVGGTESRSVVPTTQDQVFNDCDFEAYKDETTKSQRVFITGRNTTAALVSTGSGNTTALVSWSGKGQTYLAYARGNTNSTIYTYDGSSATSQGAITGVGAHMSETLISGTPNIVVISTDGGGRAWFYPDGGSLTEITDVDFPPKQTPAVTITGNAVHMDGYMFVLTSAGDIYNSDLNSLSSWSANSKIAVSRVPDLGVGLARHKDTVVAFNRRSIEFFRNTGNPSGSPLSRIPDAIINIGCATEHGIIDYNDTVAFIGYTGTGNAGVYLLDGFGVSKISSPHIDRIISSAAALATGYDSFLRLHVFQSGGQQLLALNNNTGGVTTTFHVFYPQISRWCVWTLNEGAFKSAAHGPVNIHGSVSSGVFATSVALRADYSVLLYPNDFGSTNYKLIKSVSTVGTTVAGTINWTILTNDGASSIARTITNAAGRTNKTYRLGRGNSFGIALATNNGSVSSGSCPRLQAVDVEYEVCST